MCQNYRLVLLWPAIRHCMNSMKTAVYCMSWPGSWAWGEAIQCSWAVQSVHTACWEPRLQWSGMCLHCRNMSGSFPAWVCTGIWWLQVQKPLVVANLLMSPLGCVDFYLGNWSLFYAFDGQVCFCVPVPLLHHCVSEVKIKVSYVMAPGWLFLLRITLGILDPCKFT